MAYNYLNPKTIVQTFKDSRDYTESLTDDYPEYERIIRNKPHATIPKEYPKTTDGTTAAIVRKTPHRVIQQLPTGVVTSLTDDWLSVIADFVFRKKIIPNANEGYALLQKCLNVVERSLAFGSCPTYVPFREMNGNFCTDMRLIYWADVFLQPGKLSDEDSKYIFMRSWWKPEDIEALIESQSKLSKETERTWDIEALRFVKDQVTTKDDKAKTETEKKTQNETPAVELITGFQVGKKAKFYTFHVTTGKIVRTKVNKDPRGLMPIQFSYGDVDGVNPLGRSVVDLVGSLQNLIDGEIQMYQYNRALQLNPPLLKRGNFSKNKIKFIPNIIIDLGSDPNASLEPLKIDTSSLNNFPQNYGLMKSQLLNLLSSPDTSTSAEVGNPGFSKTPAGVKSINANVSIDDNYVRKQFETFYERWAETAINLYFAEMTGIQKLQLDEETAEKLVKLAQEDKFDIDMLSDDFEVMIDYNTATEQLKFEVDASTSKQEEEVQQLESLQGIASLLDTSEFMQKVVPTAKIMELWNALVSNSGVKDPKMLKLSPDEIQAAVDEADQMKQQDAQVKQAQVEQQMAQQQQPEDTSQQVTPDHELKADKQDHEKEMDKAKLMIEIAKMKQDAEKAKQSVKKEAK